VGQHQGSVRCAAYFSLLDSGLRRNDGQWTIWVLRKPGLIPLSFKTATKMQGAFHAPCDIKFSIENQNFSIFVKKDNYIAGVGAGHAREYIVRGHGPLLNIVINANWN